MNIYSYVFKNIKGESKMEKITFELKGFACAGCLPKIEKAIGSFEGVISCKINFASSLMEVEGENLNAEKIIKTFLKFEPHVKISILDEKLEDEILDENLSDKNANISEKNWFQKNIILIAGILLYFFTIFFKPSYSVFYYLISYCIIGQHVLKAALFNITKGLFLDENFLMTLATFGAFAIGDYSEAVAVMLFYFIGETLQEYAVDNSRRSIKQAMDIAPEYANLKRNNTIIKCSPKKIKIGDIIVVKPGEKIPLDGTIISGSSTLDTSALTGESKPVDVNKGMVVLSGSLNINGSLEVKVTELYSNSTVNKILNFVQQASEKKASIEKFMTKFSRYYTPTVVAISLLVFLIPSFYTGDFKTWLYRALLFLVISCPCALVVSIPLGVFSGIGSASKNGILVKGGNYLETLGKLKAIVFDKTGTLTQGNFKVLKNTVSENIGTIIASIELNSTHPIALSIAEYYPNAEYLPLSEFSEESGLGIIATYNNDTYYIGNEKLMKKYNINFIKEESLGTIIYTAVNNEFTGSIVIGDTLRKGSKFLIDELKKHEIKSYMLSGDKAENANAIGKELGIDGKIFAQLLPGDKMKRYEEIKTEINGYTAFVGDGINDAPVLRLSDVGISLGGIGSAAALEAADIVIMDNNIDKILLGIKISKKVERILFQNVIFALGIKVLVMILGVLGFASMWLAVFADVGVALLAVLNSMRILRKE
jgi:Cd2+/Zn2+-exporting ATPase